MFLAAEKVMKNKTALIKLANAMDPINVAYEKERSAKINKENELRELRLR